MRPTVLKTKRKEKGFKQSKLAKEAQISILSYQRYESGERAPNVYTAQLIAQALQTTVEELFPLSQRNSSDNTNLTNKE